MCKTALLLVLLVNFSEEIMQLNHEYAKLLEGKGFCDNKLKITYFEFRKFNRTAKTIFLNFTTSSDISESNDIEINSKFYVWKNNDFKLTPISWSMKACSILNKGLFAIRSLIKESSLTECPLKKGAHYIRYHAPTDLEGWPSVLPDGRWKLHVEYFFEGVYCAGLEWVASIFKD